ncbi:hypothetical protein Ancab_004614 [Ancistrocladus abbreviatus]
MAAPTIDYEGAKCAEQLSGGPLDEISRDEKELMDWTGRLPDYGPEAEQAFCGPRMIGPISMVPETNQTVSLDLQT